MFKRLFAALLLSAVVFAATYYVDQMGNVSAPGSVTAGTSCPTCAGAIDLPQGTDPGSVANAFTLAGSASMTSPVIWYGPSAPCTGYVFVDPTGHISCNAGTGGGGGGGSYAGYGTEFPVTAPSSSAFSWHNQSGATETSRTGSLYLSAPSDGGNETIHGREVTAGTPPYSVTIGIVPQITVNYNNVGLYVTDGTKLITFAVTTPANGGGLQVASFPSFNAGGGGSQIVTTNVQPSGLWYLKVFDDGTNLTWSWSVDGADFVPLYVAGRTAYLSGVSAVGYFASAHHSSIPAGVLLVSFVQGNS